MFKNKKVVIGLVVLLVLVLAGGAFFFSKSKSKVSEEPSVAEEVVGNLTPEEIGLTITASPDKKKVKFSIEKVGEIKSVEYELSYEADSTAQEQGEGGEPRVQRGITGQEQVKSGDRVYESPWLDLGSCSKNVCRYDKGVAKVDLTLKIVKNDGKTYITEKSLEL